MLTRIDDLLNKIKALESELVDELQKQHEEFLYQIHQRRVYFEERIVLQHQQHVVRLFSYIIHAPLKHILTAPFIWACLMPALALDITVSLYQAVCFPVYGIPKVRRQDYLVFDRQYLNYLNLIEKLNCAFCSYFNGLIAYIQEIGARTEQFWCPIKHAQRLKNLHSRYYKFVDFGDAEAYRNKLSQVRKDFIE
ncbi:MAG: hypothetical protein EPN21_06795 [Methylococcaceae bacterium]|nr:MAG: hypothetical protein EPN21_06795 [Methylococcaceae bacterium]